MKSHSRNETQLQRRSLGIHVPLHAPALLRPPTPRRARNPHLGRDLNYRPRERISRDDVVAPTSSTAGVGARDSTLSGDAAHDCGGQRAIILPDCVGVDQGQSFPSSIF